MLGWIDRFPIQKKLIGTIVVAVASIALVLSAVGYTNSARSATHAVEERLIAVAEGRRDALADYLASIKDDLAVVATNPFTLQALNALDAGWSQLGEGQRQTLQRLYIEDNPHPTGSKEQLDFAPDGSAYSTAHASYHPWFRDFLNARGYYDIFLFNLDGDLVYTVFKELDYATNLRVGEYRNTDLGHAFRAAADTLGAGEQAFFDFQPYAPSHGAPASFVATPVIDEGGEKRGVLVFQMPVDRLNAVMASNAGMGETGEAFVVGQNNLLRTNASRASEPTLLKAQVAADMIDWESETTTAGTATSYRGNAVFKAVAPLTFSDTEWRVVATMDKSEALAPVRALRNSFAIVALLVMGVVTWIGVLLAQRITRPLLDLIHTTQRIVDGERACDVPHQSRADEIGPLAIAIDAFREAMIEAEQLTEQTRQDAEEREARAARLMQMTADFDAAVSTMLDEVGQAASNLDENATAMAAIAEETAAQSAAVTDASSTASANVQGVAAATEELSVSVASIQDIVKTSQRSTSEAVSHAELMQQRVAQLESAAGSISEVIDLITSIAAQTNLLALNATIEAARAGEAGKGFAVVASEVKELANQTSKATDDIARQVEGIQGTTKESVEAIRQIMTMIANLEGLSTEIATTIEQQSGATVQISQNVQEAAQNVQTVDSNISGVRTAAEDSGRTATGVRDAATLLTQNSSRLSEEIQRFLADVRAA